LTTTWTAASCNDLNGLGNKWPPLGPANRIAVINATTHEVQKYLLVGQRVWHMAFTPDEKYLLTTNGVSNDVSIIDVANLRIIKTIQVGELPWGIAISQQ
jgi:YVTN family beta-propeller protein